MTHHVVVEYYSDKDIAGFDFTVENAGSQLMRIFNDDSRNGEYVTQVEHHEFGIETMELSGNEIRCIGYYTREAISEHYQSYDKTVDYIHTSQLSDINYQYEHLCILEFADVPKYNISVKEFRLIDASGNVIVNAKVRTRFFCERNVINVYYINETDEYIAGAQIGIYGQKSQQNDITFKERGIVNDLSMNFIASHDTVMIYYNQGSIDGDIKSLYCIPPRSEGLFVSLLFEKTVENVCDIEKVILSNLDADELDQPSQVLQLMVNLGMDISGLNAASMDGKAMLYVQMPKLYNEVPRILHGSTQNVNINLTWEMDDFYNFIDEVEVYRWVYREDGGDGDEKEIPVERDISDAIIEGKFTTNPMEQLEYYIGSTTEKKDGVLQNFFVDTLNKSSKTYYEYAIRSIQNTNKSNFSKTVILRFCPPLHMTKDKCPSSYVMGNTPYTSNLSERMRYSARVRGSWSRR